jgi:hypothetical protein
MRTLGRAVLIVASACLGAGLALGCGGDDSDGAGDVTTGIAPSKLLADITPSEAAQACERLAAGFDRVFTRDLLVRAICTLVGAATADTPAACATTRDMCIQEADQAGSDIMMGVDMGEVDFDCEDGAVLTECSATVGQLEACFNDTLDLVSATLEGLSCDDAASVEMEDFENFAQNTFQSAPSCENVDCGEGTLFGEE